MEYHEWRLDPSSINSAYIDFVESRQEVELKHAGLRHPETRIKTWCHVCRDYQQGLLTIGQQGKQPLHPQLRHDERKLSERIGMCTKYLEHLLPIPDNQY